MPDYKTGQDLERHWRTFTDQHERKWGASCSKKTGNPCGLLEPQFTAPLMPPHHHIQVDPNDNRMVKIDYKAWIGSIEEGVTLWENRIREVVIDQGVQGTIEALIANPPPSILHIVGQKPTKRIEPIQAAKAGNAWVLGLSVVVPEKAREFFPELFEIEPQVYAPTDPFADEEIVEDPFAEEESPFVEAVSTEVVLKITDEVRDLGDGRFEVNGAKFPLWESPVTGWKTSDGEYVPRGDLKKEDYRALAQEQERALHVQE